MATPGYCIAEAYVLRKMEKEKLKKIEAKSAKKEEILQLEDTNYPSGCFSWSWLVKKMKIHPASSSKFQKCDHDHLTST